MTKWYIDTGGVRDQGTRPTCLSFALSDVHRSIAGFTELLSPEALHRAAAAWGSHAIDEATTDLAALAALQTEGQPTEAYWPYNSPTCLDPLAPFHKRDGLKNSFSSDAIAASLKSGAPVVLILDIGSEFFFYSGVKELEFEHIRPVEACHAVVIVGTKTKENQQYFRLKNSWGESWGDHGYVWASAPYVADRSLLVMQVI